MKLSKPLVVLDLETTGTWIEKDRIIEIAMVRVKPDGEKSVYCKLVNPCMPIPPAVVELTGITNEKVKDAPVFRELAAEVIAFLEGADLAGFNAERFDFPLLARECADANLRLDMNDRVIYDAQKIFHLHEKRDLSAAYSFYCGKQLDNAHSALHDVEATLAVLESQVEKYGKGSEHVEALKDFDYKQLSEFYDAERKFRWWNGELYMMFGKYARKASLKRVAETDRGYLQWILSQNFSEEIKDLVEGALEGHFPQYTAYVKR